MYRVCQTLLAAALATAALQAAIDPIPCGSVEESIATPRDLDRIPDRFPTQPVVLAPRRVAIYVHFDTIVLRRSGGLSFHAVLDQAERMAARMFADAGVEVTWRHDRVVPSRHPNTEIVEVQLEGDHALTFHPKALAYAVPFASDGVRVHVFYDRITPNAADDFAISLLAHVLTHELTHVLERSNHHTEDGLMKARWEMKDYVAMRRGVLPISEHDTFQLQNTGLRVCENLEVAGGTGARPAGK